MENVKDTANFIHAFINEDLKGELNKICTRYPPEPNGHMHIGHAKSIILNYSLAKMYGGNFNLRFDDTNPAKEKDEYVQAITNDVKWLVGDDLEGRVFFGSDYFETCYDLAVKLIKKGKAYVCQLSAEEIREYRGTLTEPGKESPYRNRPVEENLDLFEKMKNGEFEDGCRTLRAKIDMSSPNINMRDPVIYRIAKITHHNTGDKWCIYPMYDYAHPIQDAVEHITHSICTLEFEDHRPLYDWVIAECEFDNKPNPRQIEFAKLYLTNTVMGKRHLAKLVADGVVEGWDDPRLPTVSGLRRRGYTREIIWDFCDRIGVSKSHSRVDIALLEHCVRDNLKAKSKCVMAVLDPIKVVITNYPEGEEETLIIENNPENPDMGSREVLFSREIYIERDDFMEDAPAKFHRLSLGKEVRLKGAYFITCNEVIKGENGEIVELRCTYDPETKSGSGFTARKVKGTIHWVSANHAINVEVRLFDYLFFDDETAEHGVRKNSDSIKIIKNAYIEPCAKDAALEDRFQFIRNGYYSLDSKLTTDEKLVFNQTVGLKSSYK